MRYLISYSRRRIRGQRRLFELLRAWSYNITDCFPSNDILGYSYWNWKIPIPFDIVEGRRGRKRIAVQCAQLLIDTCARLAASRPDWAKDFRITCCISTPDMFGSEVCIYMDEEYFQQQMAPIYDKYTIKEYMTSKSLARRWGLDVPREFQETGFRVFMPDSEDGDYKNEWWFFGELN